jgi:hypothetical protein
MTAPGPLLALLLAFLPRWGYSGHEMASAVAVEVLPDAVPAFFRDAQDRLAYLGVEPDRWRVGSGVAMDRAWQFDHYIDLERVPFGALEQPDRFSFLFVLRRAGYEQPERDVGLLPYRILELHERLTLQWRLWRQADAASPERRWIEERIIEDAGILGHYVTDASQPLHTTIHFNGWADGEDNPEGFTSARDLHSRFERFFVDAHLDDESGRSALRSRVRERLARRGRDTAPARALIRDHLARSFGLTSALYTIERDYGFDPDESASREARDFVLDRLAEGSEMLAILWLSAWRDGTR